MKLTTLVPVIVAAACAAASIYLGSELAATRERLASAEQARAADAARIRQLEEERRFEPAPVLQTHDFTASTAAPPAPRAPTAAQPGKPAATPAPAPRGRRDPVDDTPAGQNMRRLQSEVRLRRTYADMPAALGLDATQADRLFNLLADSQVSLRDEMRAREGDADNRDDLRDSARRQRDAAIENLLGPEKAAAFQSFEKSIPARMQVNRIGESMQAANVPLSDAQRTSLIAAVMSEREALPPPDRSEASGADDADYQARFLDWQADYSSRVQARVEPLLTAAQVTQYREAIEVQNARRAQARARAERGRQSPTR